MNRGKASPYSAYKTPSKKASTKSLQELILTWDREICSQKAGDLATELATLVGNELLIERALGKLDKIDFVATQSYFMNALTLMIEAYLSSLNEDQEPKPSIKELLELIIKLPNVTQYTNEINELSKRLIPKSKSNNAVVADSNSGVVDTSSSSTAADDGDEVETIRKLIALIGTGSLITTPAKTGSTDEILKALLERVELHLPKPEKVVKFNLETQLIVALNSLIIEVWDRSDSEKHNKAVASAELIQTLLKDLAVGAAINSDIRRTIRELVQSLFPLTHVNELIALLNKRLAIRLVAGKREVKTVSNEVLDILVEQVKRTLQVTGTQVILESTNRLIAALKLLADASSDATNHEEAIATVKSIEKLLNNLDAGAAVNSDNHKIIKALVAYLFPKENVIWKNMDAFATYGQYSGLSPEQFPTSVGVTSDTSNSDTTSSQEYSTTDPQEDEKSSKKQENVLIRSGSKIVSTDPQEDEKPSKKQENVLTRSGSRIVSKGKVKVIANTEGQTAIENLDVVSVEPVELFEVVDDDAGENTNPAPNTLEQTQQLGVAVSATGSWQTLSFEDAGSSVKVNRDNSGGNYIDTSTSIVPPTIIPPLEIPQQNFAVRATESLSHDVIPVVIASTEIFVGQEQVDDSSSDSEENQDVSYVVVDDSAGDMNVVAEVRDSRDLQTAIDRSPIGSHPAALTKTELKVTRETSSQKASTKRSSKNDDNQLRKSGVDSDKLNRSKLTYNVEAVSESSKQSAALIESKNDDDEDSQSLSSSGRRRRKKKIAPTTNNDSTKGDDDGSESLSRSSRDHYNYDDEESQSSSSSRPRRRKSKSTAANNNENIKDDDEESESTSSSRPRRRKSRSTTAANQDGMATASIDKQPEGSATKDGEEHRRKRRHKKPDETTPPSETPPSETPTAATNNKPRPVEVMPVQLTYVSRTLKNHPKEKIILGLIEDIRKHKSAADIEAKIKDNQININSAVTDREGTFLHLAVYHLHVEAVKILVKMGISISAKDAAQHTALDYLADPINKIIAWKDSQYKSEADHIAAYKSVNEFLSNHENYPFYQAVTASVLNDEIVTKANNTAIVYAGFMLRTNSKQRTVLHALAARETKKPLQTPQIQALGKLIYDRTFPHDRRALLALQDAESDTALHLACRNGHLDLAIFLADKDEINVTLKNKAGDTCLFDLMDYAIQNKKLFEEDKNLLAKFKELVLALMKKGVDIHQVNHSKKRPGKPTVLEVVKESKVLFDAVNSMKAIRAPSAKSEENFTDTEIDEMLKNYIELQYLFSEYMRLSNTETVDELEILTKYFKFATKHVIGLVTVTQENFPNYNKTTAAYDASSPQHINICNTFIAGMVLKEQSIFDQIRRMVFLELVKAFEQQTKFQLNRSFSVLQQAKTRISDRLQKILAGYGRDGKPERVPLVLKLKLFAPYLPHQPAAAESSTSVAVSSLSSSVSAKMVAAVSGSSKVVAKHHSDSDGESTSSSDDEGSAQSEGGEQKKSDKAKKGILGFFNRDQFQKTVKTDGISDVETDTKKSNPSGGIVRSLSQSIFGKKKKDKDSGEASRPDTDKKKVDSSDNNATSSTAPTATTTSAVSTTIELPAMPAAAVLKNMFGDVAEADDIVVKTLTPRSVKSLQTK